MLCKLILLAQKRVSRELIHCLQNLDFGPEGCSFVVSLLLQLTSMPK